MNELKGLDPNAPLRICLTGIGGSIGAHFFAHLMTHTQWHVIGVDSMRHKGWTDRITEMLKAHPEWVERLTLYTHDLTAPFSEVLKKKIGKVDVIISMASLSDVEASIQDPVPFVQNNVNLALYLLEYAREVKPAVFVQISTDEVYGASTGKDHQHPEWSPIVPSNPYSASKAAQEALCIAYWRTYGVKLIIVNTMNNFGEMQQSNKFPVMVQKAVANDEELTIHGREGDIGSRSYIHSRNFADAVLFLLKHTTPHMHVSEDVDLPDRYNITGDQELDNLEVAQLIAKLMGKELKYRLVDFHSARSGHDKHYGLDGTKLRDLGWVSPVSFEDSMKNTIAWQTENPEWIH